MSVEFDKGDGRLIGTLNLKKIAAIVALIFICGAAPAAFADSTASMTLTSGGSNVFDGIYMGPYTATVNGVSTPVICDDFSDESFLGESWTANVSSFSNLSGTDFGARSNATAGYNEIAALSLALLNPANSSQVDQIQFAIWAVFNPSGVQSYLSGTLSSSDYTSFYTNGVLDWLSWAGTQTLTADQLAGLLIYTPNTSDAITCNGGACQSTPPQEFIAQSPVPEPGTAALFGAGLLALGIILRRKTRHQAN